jgi:uncharacterized protein (DUF2336 family)
MQCAIARRVRLPKSVSAAIIEVGTPAAALELIANPRAGLEPFSYHRIVERHGHLSEIREKLLSLPDLPSATRLALVVKLSDTLTQFVIARNWLSADRARRVASETCARSTVHVAARSRGEDMLGLVRHLRATGQLTAGLIMRALLSGNLELFDLALVELSGLPRSRVSALVCDRRGASLSALLTRAGLPRSTFQAFRVALEASHEFGFAGTPDDAARLRRTLVERVLTRCETDEETAEPLLTLLRRFAAESAREEARAFEEDIPAQHTAEPPTEKLIAA